MTVILKRNSGTTLIEILISLLILSVGMLGMLELQIVSLRSNHGTWLRTQATMFGMDIGERMRANFQGVEAGSYDQSSGALIATCLMGVGCTPAQMAAHDVFEWRTQLAEVLPMGSGIVCLDATGYDGTSELTACDGAGSLYAIKVWWDDNRDGIASHRYTAIYRP